MTLFYNGIICYSINCCFPMLLIKIASNDSCIKEIFRRKKRQFVSENDFCFKHSDC